MSTITAVVRAAIEVSETPEAADLPAAAPIVIAHNQFNQSQQFTPTTTPPGTIAIPVALNGNQTVDFNVLAGSFGTLDADTLKLRGVLINNPNTGAGEFVTMANGAANPYDINQTIRCEPEAFLTHTFGDNLAAIANGVNDQIDFACAGATDYEVVLLFG